MKRLHFLLAMLLFASWAEAIIYVDINATGSNDGTSWKNAYTSIPINVNEETRVAEGVYYPNAMITVSSTGKLIGGYPKGGSDTPLFYSHKTIIDGSSSTSRLITCNSGTLEGLYLTNASPVGDIPGAAVCAGGTSKIRYCIIYNNTSTFNAPGVLCVANSTIEMVNCLFYGNKLNLATPDVARGGLGIYIQNNTTVNIYNCTLIGDTWTAESVGLIHGANPTGSKANIYNSVVYFFTNPDSGALVGSSFTRGKFNVYSSFYNSVYFTSTTVTADIASFYCDSPELNEDYTLSDASPCANRGNNKYFLEGASAIDLKGRPRILNDTIDIGAFESDYRKTDSGCGSAPVVDKGNRMPPLRDLDIQKRIYVKDFPGETDYQRIKAAIASIPNDNKVPTEIMFENREYHFNDLSATDERVVLRLVGKNNLIVNGNGAQIYFPGQNFSDQIQMVNSTGCENLIVKNFDIDYTVLPFTQGTIVETAANYFVVEVDEGYRPLDDQFFYDADNAPVTGKNWFILKDKNVQGRQKTNVKNVFGGITYTRVSGDPTGRRFKTKSGLSAAAVGDRFVKPAFGGSTAMFTSRNGNQNTYMNINIYSCQVATCWSQGTENLNLINFKTRIKPGTNRLISSSRDGMIVSNIKNGPWLEDCLFEATGDDGLNMHVKRYLISKKVAEDQLELKTTLAVVGDSLAFYDEVNGHQIGLAVITKKESGSLATTSICTFDRAIDFLPNSLSYYSIFNLSQCCRHFVVKNTTFRFTRRYGIWLCTQQGLIENCTFEGNSWAGIATKEEFGSFISQGPVVSGVTIRNNRFIDNVVQTSNGDRAQNSSILIQGPKTVYGTEMLFNKRTDALSGMIIENNEFWGWDTRNRAAITLGNAAHSKVTGNIFYYSTSPENGYVSSYVGEGTEFTNNVYLLDNSGTGSLIDPLPCLLYPNPTTDHLFIQGIDVPYTLNIINPIGVRYSVEHRENRVSVASLLPGIYYLEVVTDKYKIIKPFIKKQ